MIAVLSALAPIFLLIALGHLVRRRDWVPVDYWIPAEWMTYYLFFPSLLFVSTAGADFSELALGPMAGALAIGLAVAALAALAVRPGLAVDGPGFSSVFQGVFRPNTYVGVAGAAALWDQTGLTLVALCILVWVPAVNALSVLGLSLWAGPAGTRVAPRRVALELARNPLILAPLAGALVNVAGVGLPPVIGPFLEILGRAALPIGLLAVGAGLDVRVLEGAGRGAVAVTSVVKLAVVPAAIYLACRGLGVDGTAAGVCVLYGSLPVSASSYVLARRLGGDAPLMAAIITFSTLAAVVTMPVVMALLG